MNNLRQVFYSLRMVWAVLAAFAVGSLLILATDHNPIEAYGALFQGAFFDYYGLADTLIKMCPMLLAGLAVIIPMRCGLLNVGGEGQIYIGGLAAAAVALYLPAAPAWLHLLLCLLAGMLGGGLWGAIPGYLRATRGINEVIVTLLMNYVGINIVSYFAGGPMMQDGAPYPYSNEISDSLWLPIFLPHTDTHIGVFIAVALSLLAFWVLRYTTVGFSMAAVGKSPKAAHYAGMSINRHIIGSMIAGGAVAGLAGAVEVVGVKYRLYHLFSPGYGYDGIVVAFMASLNPLFAALSAFFLAGLSTGAQFMQRAIGLDVTAIEALRGLIVIFVAAGLIWRLRQPKPSAAVAPLVSSTLSSQGQKMMDATYLAIVSTGLRLSVPLIFAALGGIWSERAGVFNLALEGSLLCGAFGAALGSFYFHSAWAGLAVGLFAAGLTGLLLAVMTVWLSINQMVAGIAINMFAIGITAFLSRIVFSGQGASDSLTGFSTFAIPGLSSIPIVGNLLFNQDFLVYLMYALVPLAWWLLFHTSWGLNLRATGEYPRAVDSAGLSVFGIRFISVVGSGVIAGLGGCYLVLSQVFIFTEHMSAGKGFIALAALILGRWHPIGAVAACLLFGLADALQLRLQFSHPDVPYQLFVVLPYVASIGALIIFAGKIRPPAAAGEHYQRGGK